MTLREALLDTLHPTYWKTSSVVWKEIEAYKYKGGQPFKSVSIGSIIVTLDHLLAEELIVKRESLLTPEELEARGGRKSDEFRLSKNGLHKRTERHQAGERELLQAMPSVI